jgi:hypothetical protein
MDSRLRGNDEPLNQWLAKPGLAPGQRLETLENSLCESASPGLVQCLKESFVAADRKKIIEMADKF